MRYIIMCGGTYTEWQIPRQLTRVKGEMLVARTIRLLREAGVEDIAISSDNPVFEQFGVPVLHHNNDYVATCYTSISGYWSSAFYPMDEPVCYIFGDVVFSPEAPSLRAFCIMVSTPTILTNRPVADDTISALPVLIVPLTAFATSA